MGMPDVTRASVLQAVEEADALGRDSFLEKYGFGEARSYFLMYDGRSYDSKAIVGAAHGYARPDLGPLRSGDFTGGEAPVRTLLGRLGFEVTSPTEKSSRGRNPTWTRDELILALDHYVRHPGSTHDPHSSAIQTLSAEISAVARLLGITGTETLRNANGVSMKLLNFRAHDPTYQAKGQTGLSRGNRLEGELWTEFASDPARLRAVADAIRARIDSPDPSLVEALAAPDEPEIAEAEEGRVVTKEHRVRERDRDIVKRKKESFRRRHGRLFCEVCDFDFASRYGPRGDDFIECHHVKPVAAMRPGDKTRLEDLVLLCANCHRMVHVRSPWLSIPELTALIGDVGVPVQPARRR